MIWETMRQTYDDVYSYNILLWRYSRGKKKKNSRRSTTDDMFITLKKHLCWNSKVYDLRVCWDIAYFAKTENYLLKIL